MLGLLRISNLFIFIAIKGRPQYRSNVEDRHESLCVLDLVSELRGLQAAIYISLASSIDRRILDSPVAMTTAICGILHLTQRRSILELPDGSYGV
jgi:hypothetical protein